MNRIAEYFDDYGEREWTRFEDGRNSHASLDTHMRFLARFVRPGDRVLDAGAGPGRFSLELVRLGAEVTALDLSEVQLELLRQRVDAEAVVGDIRDLSRFDDATFDVVVCFGGPLSYTFGEGASELARVVKPNGFLLVSVMSLVGVVVHYARELVELARTDGVEKQLEIIDTGVLPEEKGYGHLAMQLYRWRELEELLAAYGTVVARAGAGIVPTLAPEEPQLADFLVALERRVSEDPSSFGVGQHMLAAVQVAA